MATLRRCVLVGAAVTILLGLVVTGTVTGTAGATTSTFSATSAQALRVPAPFWMSAAIQRRITAAGAEGASLEQIQRWVDQGLAGAARQDQTVAEPCPTVDAGYKSAEPTVKAGACQVAPFGCTANFIYYKGPEPVVPPTSDGRHHFIGTAGHCVERANQPVFMQVSAAGVVARVGEVEKILAGDIGRNGFGNGGIGNDFAIIEIDPGFQVDPQMPAPTLGPQGIYTGCEPRAVEWYGHGLGVAVGQGRHETGLATNWYDRSYGWTSATGLPGDSGSGVLTADGAAAGNLTHLLVDPERYPGSTLAGTRVTRALTWMGAGYHLVNEDYTTARATMTDTDCGNANPGAGS